MNTCMNYQEVSQQTITTEQKRYLITVILEMMLLDLDRTNDEIAKDLDLLLSLK